MSNDGDLVLYRSLRGTVISASLNMVGMPIELAIGAGIESLSPWPIFASSAVGAATLAVLLWRRRSMTMRLVAGAFLVNNAVIIAAVTYANEQFATYASSWAPFQANKLGALAVSLLAPGIGVGLITIVGFAGSAIGQFLLFAPEIKQRLAVGEPWTTLAYGAFGVALLVHHLRRRQAELVIVRARAQQAAATRLAERLLAVRDLANTPLQTIELTAALLRARPSPSAASLERLDRALLRLRDLNAHLNALQEGPERAPSESFDPRAKLRR